MSEPLSNVVRLGLIGPDNTQPCGIADYTLRLSEALSKKCELVFRSFNNAFGDVESRDTKASQPIFKSCSGILVQYELSLVPDSQFLACLSRQYPKRIYLVPHEVYLNDPFAFPYAELHSKFLPLLWLKQLRYRQQHREFFAEKKLQTKAYHAHRVIPLSGPGYQILHALAGSKVLPTIPVAQFIPSAPAAMDENEKIKTGKLLRSNFFTPKVKIVVGIFGFLNPSLDYAMVFDLVESVSKDIGILLIGGTRTVVFSQELLEKKIKARGLESQVKITGFIAESKLASHFEICDLFLSPMISKSNSSSILNMLHLKKIILTPDLPLCQYLKSEGAPLELYQNKAELSKKIVAFQSGQLKPSPNQYPWTFDTVAEAYLKAILSDQ